MSNKKVLMASIICGLIAAVLLNFYLKSIKDAAANTKIKTVAYANVNIPAKTLVTADMISLKKVPVDFAHPNSVTEASQVLGHSTKDLIMAGEQILNSKIVAKESTGSTMAYTIPLGMRAISITVNQQSGMIGLINPGDRVDVMGTVDIEEQSKDPNVKTVKHTMTHLIMQNIEVLAVGSNYTDPNTMDPNIKKEDQNNGGSIGEATVTLAVPASEIQFLVAVSDKGKITLALRPAGDKSEEDRPAIDAVHLLR